MSIKKFIWNNGTSTNPVVLTTNQIKTLIAAGTNAAIETEVSGVVKASTSIPKYLKLSLERCFPNLTVIANTVADDFAISLNVNTMSEGESTTIVVSGSSGMSASDLQYQIIYEEGSFVTDGYLTLDDAKSRITCVNGVIQVSGAKENSSWQLPIRVKCCSLTEDIDTTTEYKTTSVIICKGIAVTGITLSAETMTVNGGESVDVSYEINPATNTKSAITSVSLELTQGNGTLVGNTYVSEDKKGDTVIRAMCSVLPSASYISTVTINVVATMNTKYSLYNEDYSGSLGAKAPASEMVSGDSVTVKGLPDTYGANYESNYIYEIRKNSHLYSGIYNRSNNVMYIKQLDDADKSLYSDGEFAGSWYMVLSNSFLRLPSFYYKINNTGNSIEVSFSSKQDSSGSYTKWNGDTLIGTYQASALATLRSIPADLSTLQSLLVYSNKTGNFIDRINTFLNKASYSSDFRILDYNTFNVMTLLYLGYYGQTSTVPSEVLHTVDDYSIITQSGTTDKYGMTDILKGKGDTATFDNFWGLEGWWSNVPELIGDINIVKEHPTYMQFYNNSRRSNYFKNVFWGYWISEMQSFSKFDNLTKYTEGCPPILYPISSVNVYDAAYTCFYGPAQQQTSLIWNTSLYENHDFYKKGNAYMPFVEKEIPAGTQYSRYTTRLMYFGNNNIQDVTSWTRTQFESINVF